MSPRDAEEESRNVGNTASSADEANETTPLLLLPNPAAHRRWSCGPRSTLLRVLQFITCVLTVLTAFGTLIVGLAAEKRPRWQSTLLRYVSHR